MNSNKQIKRMAGLLVLAALVFSGAAQAEPQMPSYISPGVGTLISALLSLFT